MALALVLVVKCYYSSELYSCGTVGWDPGIPQWAWTAGSWWTNWGLEPWQWLPNSTKQRYTQTCSQGYHTRWKGNV